MVTLSLPPMTLDAALLALAQASGVDLVSTESGLRSVRTHALTGRMSVERALRRLLDGTPYRAEPTSHGGYRVVAAPRRRPPKARTPPRMPHPAFDVPAPIPADIVVTASKQRVPLLRYPGSLTLLTGAQTLSNGGTGDLSTVSEALPILQGTQLGPGRNKIFIRGIADSSFNGTTQSTASVYLDDVQLNASGPDPGLRLYDMQAVEVLEGPQGTLYGAGAIGGVLRLTSNAPDLARAGGAVSAGLTATQNGAPGYDLAGTLNLPLVADRVGLRGVAYGVQDGGYIDDSRRKVNDVNRTRTQGVRLALRVDPGSGWRVDTSGVVQRIQSRDGQYTQAGDRPLVRGTRSAQPFSDRFLFGRVVVTKDWDSGLRLVSATGIADYRTSDVFDATPSGGVRPATLYNIDNDKLLISQELRLSGTTSGGGSWLGGITLVSDRSILSRAVGTTANAMDIVGVSNVTRAASAFGEATYAVRPDLSLTLGGRYTTARVDGEPSSTRRSTTFIKGRSTQRFDPTAALSWRLGSRLAAFARYQTGFRTGGLAVAQGIGRVANYDADSIELAEVGVRRLRRGASGLGFGISATTAFWKGIQADLLNRRGAPFTTNLGDARIRTVEASIDWVPVPRLTVAGSALYAYTLVTGPIADQSRMDNRRLPETPPFAAHLALAYSWPEDSAIIPRVGVAADYVGRSVLGTGDLLDVSQGNYVTLGTSAGVRWRNWDATLGVDNLTNTTANRFAFGNPFGLVQRNQATPLRPRNIRLGVGVRW